MTPVKDATLTAPWRKSTRSGGGNDCVEVAQNGPACLVRDSKHPDGTRLAVEPRAWAAFLGHVRHGAYGG